MLASLIFYGFFSPRLSRSRDAFRSLRGPHQLARCTCEVKKYFHLDMSNKVLYHVNDAFSRRRKRHLI